MRTHTGNFFNFIFQRIFATVGRCGSALSRPKKKLVESRERCWARVARVSWFFVGQHNREFILWRIDCTFPNSIISRITVVSWFVWLFALKVFVVETWERCRPRVARVIVVWFRIIRFFWWRIDCTYLEHLNSIISGVSFGFSDFFDFLHSKYTFFFVLLWNIFSIFCGEAKLYYFKRDSKGDKSTQNARI